MYEPHFVASKVYMNLSFGVHSFARDPLRFISYMKNRKFKFISLIKRCYAALHATLFCDANVTRNSALT